MAATLLSLPLQPVRPAAERHCPIRIISVQLLDAAGQLLRVLFLDREGHISSQPHYLPREEALILAANQQRMLGSQAPPLPGKMTPLHSDHFNHQGA